MHASQDGAPFGFAASAHSRPSWASCCSVWPARGLVGTAGTTVHAGTARAATIIRDKRITPPPSLIPRRRSRCRDEIRVPALHESNLSLTQLLLVPTRKHHRGKRLTSMDVCANRHPRRSVDTFGARLEEIGRRQSHDARDLLPENCSTRRKSLRRLPRRASTYRMPPAIYRMPPAMNIVDSQVHIWGPDTPQRPWPPGRATEAQKPYPISQETLLFQMDLAGVRRMVLVPPSWEGD